jgi:hypothetical protein
MSHDAINGGETEAISDARFLGGKKGLKKAGTGFGVNPTTGVADGESDPGIAKLVMSIASWLGSITISGMNGDSAAGWHGVSRIQYQIEDNLLNLRRIHSDHTEIIREIRDQLDILANQST